MTSCQTMSTKPTNIASSTAKWLYCSLFLLIGSLVLQPAIAQTSVTQTSVDGDFQVDSSVFQGDSSIRFAGDDTADDAALYYSVARNATVFNEAGGSTEVFKLTFREPVNVVERKGLWSLIETEDGKQGYVANKDISNIWIRISKRKKSVYFRSLRTSISSKTRLPFLMTSLNPLKV